MTMMTAAGLAPDPMTTRYAHTQAVLFPALRVRPWPNLLPYPALRPPQDDAPDIQIKRIPRREARKAALHSDPLWERTIRGVRETKVDDGGNNGDDEINVICGSS